MPVTIKFLVAVFGLSVLVPAQFVIDFVTEPAVQREVHSPFEDYRNIDLKKAGHRMAERMRQEAAERRLLEIDALIGKRVFVEESNEVRKLRVQAIQIRDAILSRMPHTRRPDLPYAVLEFATTAEMIEEGAELLDTLSRLLPDMFFREEERTLPPPPAASVALQVS